MLKCTFMSATNSLEETELESLSVQAVTGELGILRGHMPLIAKLKDNSQVRLNTAAEQKYYTLTQNSFLYFKNDEAIILTQDFNI